MQKIVMGRMDDCKGCMWLRNRSFTQAVIEEVDLQAKGRVRAKRVEDLLHIQDS